MIDRTADRPLYRQVADELRNQISSEVFRPGELLPSQSKLFAKYGLTTATVRRAIEVLRKEGLVETIIGSGIAVRQPPTVVHSSSTRYAETLAKLEAGETPLGSAFTRDHNVAWDEFRVACKFKKVPAPEKVAGLLGVEVGTVVFRRNMTRIVRGTPTQLLTSYYPLDLVEGTAMTDARQQPWPGGVIAELKALDITVTKVDEYVIARMPTPAEAGELVIPDGVPVQERTRVGWSGDRVVEVVAPVVERGDKVVLHYQTTL